jgi:hypothetical protein
MHLRILLKPMLMMHLPKQNHSNLAANITSARSKCSAARAGVGTLAGCAMMKWKTIFSQEQKLKICCVCCAILLKPRRRLAKCVVLKLRVITAPCASSGTTIQGRQFTTATIVASADLDKVWEGIFSIARPAWCACRLPRSPLTDASNNLRNAIAPYVANTCSPRRRPLCL